MSLPARRAAERTRRSHRLVVAGAVTVGLGLLAILFAVADGRTLLQTARAIPPAMLIMPMLLAVASYAAMARSYQRIADAAGSRLPFGTWLRLTFVSNTVNYLVTSAGLSGFAVRMFLLKQNGVASGRAVLISLVQTFLTNATLLCFIVAGWVNLFLHQQLAGTTLAAASAVVIVFLVVLAVAALMAAHRTLRRRTLLWLANTTHRVLRHVAPSRAPRRVRLWRFQHNLNEGFEFLLRRKRQMVAPAIWIMLDWFLTLGILWWAFRSVNVPVAFGLVLAGFGVGVLLSLVSLVPGGLGVMEGSMTGVFVSFGVPLESAVVAVLIFRVAYYVLPLLVSVFFFHGLLRQATHSLETETDADAYV